MTIYEMQELINGVPIDQFGKQAIGLTANSISELNRKQLQQGKYKEGNSLPDYSRTSVEVFGKPQGAIKLYDTGTFYKSIKNDVGSEFVETIADDPNNLIERYNQGNVLGLPDSESQNYNENIFYPEFAKLIEQKTGLQFK